MISVRKAYGEFINCFAPRSASVRRTVRTVGEWEISWVEAESQVGETTSGLTSTALTFSITCAAMLDSTL